MHRSSPLNSNAAMTYTAYRRTWHIHAHLCMHTNRESNFSKSQVKTVICTWTPLTPQNQITAWFFFSEVCNVLSNTCISSLDKQELKPPLPSHSFAHTAKSTYFWWRLVVGKPFPTSCHFLPALLGWMYFDAKICFFKSSSELLLSSGVEEAISEWRYFIFITWVRYCKRLK